MGIGDWGLGNSGPPLGIRGNGDWGWGLGMGKLIIFDSCTDAMNRISPTDAMNRVSTIFN
ncbi:hypothetical protein [Tolypothrix sp. PCC 7601]|uniref:hypothetical protein n=1 Tax=Tolypothrix sp. PCC 7601 TaxID=1188 RepID=UPI0005EAB97A|nr:hypothetical protein [Tolypothrix sp. PCC 7601]EKF01670.1 hypothetical protein FDUTEX481_07827 [Tolypothrix sp. PCC 7601]